jgi:hypothetical protein
MKVELAFRMDFDADVLFARRALEDGFLAVDWLR